MLRLVEESSVQQAAMAAESGDSGQGGEGPDPASELLAELSRLREEHRDLDAAIGALERSVAGDQLQIQRLKKRKLTLRDRIHHIEDQITPDIIA